MPRQHTRLREGMQPREREGNVAAQEVGADIEDTVQQPTPGTASYAQITDAIRHASNAHHKTYNPRQAMRDTHLNPVSALTVLGMLPVN